MVERGGEQFSPTVATPHATRLLHPSPLPCHRMSHRSIVFLKVVSLIRLLLVTNATASVTLLLLLLLQH